MSKDLSYIIDPIDRALLKEELSKERWVRKTNKLDNDIYIVNHHNAPNVMQEIGRLREISFASADGGTGNPVDIDEMDTADICYDQLIVYSAEDEEIVGGYRFMDCSKVVDEQRYLTHLSTSHYFTFSDKFINNYLPETIELGRSWVQPKFQPSQNPRKGMFALDNIWDGLGAVIVNHPHAKHFYGKVTMYPTYDREARNALYTFMTHQFPDHDQLVIPKHPLEIAEDTAKFVELIKGLDFKEGYKMLNRFTRARGENVPPLFTLYMHLSATMKSFGTCVNPDFGDVEETGILVTIEDIRPEKKDRHLVF